MRREYNRDDYGAKSRRRGSHFILAATHVFASGSTRTKLRRADIASGKARPDFSEIFPVLPRSTLNADKYLHHRGANERIVMRLFCAALKLLRKRVAEAENASPACGYCPA
jgi:hypothetical protein